MKTQSQKQTQKQMAGIAGISPQGLSNIFNGRRRPSPATAKRLESTTGVPATTWLYAEPSEIKAALEAALAPRPAAGLQSKAIDAAVAGAELLAETRKSLADGRIDGIERVALLQYAAHLARLFEEFRAALAHQPDGLRAVK